MSQEPDLYVADMGGGVLTYHLLHLKVAVLVVTLDHLCDPLATLCP